jgi:RND family efflux transporter MFP subunit
MSTTEPVETEETTRHEVERPEGPPATGRTGAPGRWRRILIGVVLPPLVVLGGAAGAYRFVSTRPGMPERPPRPSSTLVTVTPVTPTTERVTVEAMGTVVPARETVLMPQVSGRIVWLSPEFLIGGRFRKDEEMLRLEKRDYELAVEQRRADVARAECDVKLEEGQQIIAKAELDVTGLAAESEASRDLILRKPHLKRVQAALAAAQASLEDARLDLERTVVRAPFNAVVTGQHVDLGTQASPQTRLVTLVGTDAYWVKVSLPVEKLAWIRVPRRPGEEGAAAEVRQAGLGVRDVRPGRVIRSLAQMETAGRLANLLVEVKDPLDLGAAGTSRPPLLLGAYVEVAIEGRTLENVVALPRGAVREGKRAWIMTPENTLAIREIDVVWRDRERVLVAGGLAAGERVVTSAIPTPVNGMRLRVVGGARRDERAEGPDDRVSKVGAGAESDASTAAPPVEGERP